MTQYLKDVKDYYDMSILSLRFPGLKIGYESLTNLYDTLGRRQTNVLKMEQRLVEQSSHETAIDGHVIGCESGENDLAEKGYKFQKLGEEQVNLLMAYDVNTGVPLVIQPQRHVYVVMLFFYLPKYNAFMLSGMEWNIISTTVSAGVMLSCISHSWVMPMVP